MSRTQGTATARFVRAATLSLLLTAVSFAAQAVEVGEPAPGFELPRLGGDGQVRLADLEGHWVYVDFWASWCAPCRESFPWMNRLAASDEHGDLRIVAVGVDRKRSNAEAFDKKYESDFPVVWDSEQKMPEAYGVKAMPSSYLIGPDGVVRYVHFGFRASDKKLLWRELAAVIAKEEKP